MLSKIAYYLGEVINQDMEISAGALQMRATEKVVFVPDRERPVLRYKLGFDRAWATVGIALESADVQLLDLDRSEAVYYVSFDEETRRRRFFGKKRSKRKRAESADEGQRLEVRLQTVDAEVHVTVLQVAGDPLAIEQAERLLKIIKEHST